MPHKNLVVLLSPFVMITAGHLVARWAAERDPQTAWVFVAVTYWALIAFVTALGTTKAQRRGWFRRSTGHRGWVWTVGILLGLFPIAGILLMNLNLVAVHPTIAVAVLAFAIVNPVFEESYWRGALLDAGRKWPFWLIALYSTILFVASHPLMWGVFSIGNRSVMLYATLFVMGMVWAYMRRATKSLRIPLLSHALVDVGNLSVFVFLNLYVPPAVG